jgi:tetratricopeptide (TPR) repeat protein
MHYRLLHSVLAAALFATPALADVDALVAEGDRYAAKFKSDAALKAYLAAEKEDPSDADLLARISRQYRHKMSDASREEEKRRLGQNAVNYAERAIQEEPDDADAQLALAISLAKLLPLQGNRERMEGSRRIKEAAEKAIALDPQNDLGWHILGRWNLLLADVGPVRRAVARVVYGKLPPATNEAAVKYFERAIQLNPNRLMHYIELGRTYAQMGQKREARKFIEKGLEMRETEKDDPETKARGREILRRL